MLPLCTAGFQFRDKTYRFVVNGRSGKVRGERPYSIVKIVLTGLVVLAVLLAAVFLMQESGGFGALGSPAFDEFVPRGSF